MASEQLTYPLDHNKQEALNLVLEIVAGDHGILTAASIWYDSVEDKIAYVAADGSTIRYIPLPSEGGGDADTLDGQLPSYYLNRANHTGSQLAATISNLAATVQAYRLDQFANPTASVNLNSQKIINLAAGTAASDAANKGQLDSAVAGKADTTYVDDSINALIDGAGAAYNTLKELQDLILADETSLAALTTAVNLRARKFTAVIGNGSATQIDVVHNFANRHILYAVWSAASPWGVVRPGPSQPDANTLRLNFTTAPTTGQYNVEIVNTG